LSGMKCNFCGGLLVCLGVLGNRRHFRCQACGLEVQDKAKWWEEDEEAQP